MRPGSRVGVVAVSVVVAVGAVVVRPRRVVVEGRSMEPTLAPGDRLLVVRAPEPARRATSWRCATPGTPSGCSSSGSVRCSRTQIVLRGDNPEASTDSRSFGPVPTSAVLGRVIRCYAPSWRAGPVR